MPSVVDRFCRFLDRAERSPLTRRNYRSDLEGLKTWFEGQNGRAFSPDQITSTDLREYKAQLAGQALKPATINRKLASLRCFLNWAVDVRLLRSGHGVRVPKPVREQRRGPRWLDRREQHRLTRVVERAGKPRDITAILLMLNTGVRVAELCALVWRDIPLNKDARRVLLLLGYRDHAGKATPVFVGQRGPLTPRGFELLLERYVKTANLKDVTPHSLRHSFCKNLANADVSLEKIAALAGHESLETTRRYCEPSLGELQEAVELVSEEE